MNLFAHKAERKCARMIHHAKSNSAVRLFRRTVAVILTVVLCGCCAASAAKMDDVPYASYTYWEGPSRYNAVPMRTVYEANALITGDSLGTTPLKNASFVTLSPDKSELYIMDSGNGRILIVDALHHSLKAEITEILHDGETLSFQGAKGLFISQAGDIYVADTDHNRVLKVNRDGELLQQIDRPTGNGIPDDLDFRPVRMALDNKGYLYVVSEGCYYGMLVFDDTLNFLGFHGAYMVETGVLSALKEWITDLFMTNEKNSVGRKKLPSEVLDVAVDSTGALYTLSSSETGQIKRLGLNGGQTLNYKFGFVSKSGNAVNFGESPSSFWHKHFQYALIFSALTVDDDGFIYAVDSGRSRIFMYDEECRMMTAFSNGYSEGNQVGTFVTPISIAYGNDSLYVLDFVYGSVTVFQLTEYGRDYKRANLLTIDGEYEAAQPLWENVLRLDANNQRAYEGLGKSMLAQQNYEEAMQYAKQGNDQQTYALAFTEVQKVFLQHNFWWIFLLCIVGVGCLAAALVISKRKKLFTIRNAKVSAALTTCIHPFQAFQSLKYQKNTSILLATVFIVVFYLAKVSEDLYGGFMYVITDATSYNALYTLLGSVGVVLLWVISNWAICTLFDGKGTLKEVYTMTAYCLMPLIVYSVIFIIASHLIPSTGTSTFAMLSTIAMIYMVVMLLIGMTVVHEYSFFKAIGMAVLTVLGMLLTAFVIFSLWLLAQQFVVFIASIVTEAMLK